MKAEFVGPLVQSAASVMSSVLNTPPQRGNPSACAMVRTQQEINVVCGIIGEVEGQIIYGLSQTTGAKIAAILLAQPIESFNPLAASAVCDLGNKISEAARQVFGASKIECDFTIPKIVHGHDVKVCTTERPGLVFPFTLEGIGEVEITVSLIDSARRAAA